MPIKKQISVLLAASALALCGTAQASKVGFAQAPDMVAGTDYTSMHRANGPVVADDFVVHKNEIVGLRWWGSYFQDDPLSPPGPGRVVSFEISYHPDCVANAAVSAQCPGDPRNGNLAYPYSTPGQPYQFQVPVLATEVLFGITAAGERVYEYFAWLDTPLVAVPGVVSWLDIAWIAGQFGTDFSADVWGWHESNQHFKDFAVQTDRLANATLPLGGNPHLGPWVMLGGHDMAFEVITVPEPGTLALLGLSLGWLVYIRRREPR